ncbi:capsular polysaccharide biosynthesis protein [Hydrogenophaga sp.]|uniref:capsular polysaccharide biosynthesis protein n=1 Tax=Hydrogenophaga sp. TaxID=1904254 RepID=UPI003F6AAD63
MLKAQPTGGVTELLCTSDAVHGLHGLGAMLQARVLRASRLAAWVRQPTRAGQAVVAWGRKPSATHAEAIATRQGLPLLRLEDGFLRSFGTGQHFAPLSLVVDKVGIYYDSTRPSALEALLASGVDVLDGLADDVARAKALLLAHRLSKYNHAQHWVGELAEWLGEEPPSLPSPKGGRSEAGERGVQRVLVVDQTAGDLSVALGGANADTFAAMLAAARAENPQATVYVKTHPEVTSGRKGGYLTAVQDTDAGGEAHGPRTVVLRQAINPLSLIKQMDRVYVVTSTMGFEALLAGKRVTCFGLPWYAGWGATDDRQSCPRRNRLRTVDELFAAAYFHYTRYLNPATHERGNIFDVMDWLVRQRNMAGLASGQQNTHTPKSEAAPKPTGRVVCVGFALWRRYNLAPLLSLFPERVHFVRHARAAARLGLGAGDALVCWGGLAPAGVQALAQHTGAQLLRMEDGFVRGVGLGSDLIRPLSLVLDGRGIYFNPSQPSDLEHLLSTAQFTPDELARAQRVRETVVAHGITKYNLEPREPVAWHTQGRQVVLVPGQVEDDASVRLGCTGVKTNLGLLQAARRACPEAFIVYKPHPDVVSGNRRGTLALAAARAWADHVETGHSVVSCIEACDELHTMTSLAGFDALLRGKRVVVYGQPFYAGWGLTQDVAGAPALLNRRRQALSLDELVAGALLRYPLYWDWALRGYTTCEAVLHQVVKTRTALERSGELQLLRNGWLRRQCRKLGVLARAVWNSL